MIALLPLRGCVANWTLAPTMDPSAAIWPCSQVRPSSISGGSAGSAKQLLMPASHETASTARREENRMESIPEDVMSWELLKTSCAARVQGARSGRSSASCARDTRTSMCSAGTAVYVLVHEDSATHGCVSVARGRMPEAAEHRATQQSGRAGGFERFPHVETVHRAQLRTLTRRAL